MNFSDLETYFPTQNAELEIEIEDASSFDEGDYVTIISDDAVLVKRAKDDNS